MKKSKLGSIIFVIFFTTFFLPMIFNLFPLVFYNFSYRFNVLLDKIFTPFDSTAIKILLVVTVPFVVAWFVSVSENVRREAETDFIQAEHICTTHPDTRYGGKSSKAAYDMQIKQNLARAKQAGQSRQSYAKRLGNPSNYINR